MTPGWQWSGLVRPDKTTGASLRMRSEMPGDMISTCAHPCLPLLSRWLVTHFDISPFGGVEISRCMAASRPKTHDRAADRLRGGNRNRVCRENLPVVAAFAQRGAKYDGCEGSTPGASREPISIQVSVALGGWWSTVSLDSPRGFQPLSGIPAPLCGGVQRDAAVFFRAQWVL